MTPEALTNLVIACLGLSEEQAAALRPSDSLVVVSAGAGTGKTTTMAARFALTVLRGEARGLGATEAALGTAAVTFTELAAGELRARIGGALNKTRIALESAGEADLAAYALAASEQLPQAPIGTIHGLCARLLRRSELAAMANVPPDFTVLDVLDSGLLWQRAVEDALDDLALKDPERLRRILAVRDGAARLKHTVRSLAEQLDDTELAELAVRTRPAFQREVLSAAVELLHRTCDPQGASPMIASAVAEASRRSVALGRAAGGGFLSALDVLKRWCSGTGSAPLASEKISGVGATEKRLAALTPNDGEALEAFSAAVSQFKRVADRVVAGLAPDVIDAEHRWTSDMVTLAAATRAEYGRLKESLAALDFADLEAKSLVGLRRHAAHASELGTPWPRPFKDILVDELQDTSRVQRDLLLALLGDSLDGLFAVGDPKQSIYRFRHADVAVFQRLFEQAGAHGLSLTINRRSSPQVLAFVNALFGRLFPASVDPSRPYAAPAQRLTAARTTQAPRTERAGGWPAVVVVPVPLERASPYVGAHEMAENGKEDWGGGAPAPTPLPELNAAERRDRDAQATSRITANLVADGVPVAVLLRAVRGGNRAYLDALDGLEVVAELAASGTFTLQAATALGITVARAFAVLGNDAAWVALLRSPLVGLVDRDVARVAQQARRTGEPIIAAARWLLAAEPLLLGVAGDRLRRVLTLAVDGAQLHQRMAWACAWGDVRSRQLDKLLALVSDLEAQGRGPVEVMDVLDELVASDRSKRVPDPVPPQALDADSATLVGTVQALTVHASKGLEFDTVVVPQLVSAPAASSFVTPEVVWLDSCGWRVGLALPGGAPSVLKDANRALELEREAAEQARLLYVALTRARDRIVVNLPVAEGPGGHSDRAGVGGQQGADTERLDTPITKAIRDLLGVGPASGVGPVELDGIEVHCRWLPAAEQSSVAPVEGDRGEETLTRGVFGRKTAFDGPFAWSVTDLARLAYCPAYYAQHRLAPAELTEAELEGASVLDQDARPKVSMSGQERGIVVHHLLADIRTIDDIDALKPPGVEGRASSSVQASTTAAVSGEWLRLRENLRRLAERPELHAMFRAQGLWREFELAAKVDGVLLSGAFDRLSLAPEPAAHAGAGPAANTDVPRLRAEIGEFKTGRRGWNGVGGREPAYGAAHHLQLAAYVVMLKAWLGERLVEPVRTHLMFVDLGCSETLDWTYEHALSTLRRVLGEIHQPMSLPLNRAACPQCPIQATCAAQ